MDIEELSALICGTHLASTLLRLLEEHQHELVVGDFYSTFVERAADNYFESVFTTLGEMYMLCTRAAKVFGIPKTVIGMDVRRHNNQLYAEHQKQHDSEKAERLEEVARLEEWFKK